MNHLYLLSFSLAFLTQGIANDISHEEATKQFKETAEQFKETAKQFKETAKQFKETAKQFNDDDHFDQAPSFDDEKRDDYLSDAQEPLESPNPQSACPQPQPVCPQPQPVCPTPEPVCLGPSPYHPVQISIRHNEARGIGYEDGYTTLEAFGIYDGYSSHFMPFIDVRGHVFNDGKLAGNLGIGERTLFSCIEHTLGTYLYYDVRRVGKGLTVNQLSPGLELVGKRMEYRINGYFPVGKEKGRKYGFEFDEFKGNNIFLKYKQYHAMTGFDAEVGAHLTQSTKYDVYAAAGPYYFRGSHASSWGGRTRVLGRYKEYISLEVAYSYDHLFHSRVEGSIAFTLPLGPKMQRTSRGCPPKECCPQIDDLLLARASFAPSRFEIPVVKKSHRKEKAIDPATGKPWTVWFVNNTSHSNGTFESPFPTLLMAQNASAPNDMIYVFPGDGTSNGMNAGITLKDWQDFFGSGIKHQFATTKGTMTIPAFSRSNPSITNTGGDVVDVGNGNTVSGFNILATAGAGIGMPLPLTNGVIIQNNNITDTGSQNGIDSLSNLVTGIVDISGNQMIGTSSNEGIFILFTNTQQITISKNTLSGFSIGLDVEGDGSPFAMQVYRNSVSNFSFGMLFNGLTNATVNANGNTFNGGMTSGACITLANVFSSSANNNVMTTNGSGIDVSSIVSTGIQHQSEIANNIINITGGGQIGIHVHTNSDPICSSIVSNQVTTTGTGLNLTATGSGVINIVEFAGNIIPNVVSSGNVNLVAPGTCTP